MNYRIRRNERLFEFFQIGKNFSPRMFRLGLVLALIMYGTFGYLDFYAMPSNYSDSWVIRFAIIGPLLLIAFALSYYKPVFRYSKIILFLLLTIGQLGILFMIGISVSGDLAYYSYYAGLILVMLWACFVFRINFTTTVYIAVTTVLFYNITAIFYQDIFSFPFGSEQSLVLLNNNFFLIGAAILAIIGAYLIDGQEKEIRRVHHELLMEKEQLKFAKEKAEESDRLKSAFLANMSHEIRTPLNSIIGFSELVTDPYFDQKQHLEFAGIINQSGNNLLSILTNIMDISKIEAGQYEVKMDYLSVKQLCSDVQREFVLKAKKKGIDLILNLGNREEDVLIKSDKTKLRQVLVNLVDNAMKFTVQGFIEIGTIAHENEIQFHVKDTGIGVTEENYETIFERFRQVDSSFTRRYGGNGLGLAISKSLVEMLGGKIWMESAHGKGSVFYFTIPKEI